MSIILEFLSFQIPTSNQQFSSGSYYFSILSANYRQGWWSRHTIKTSHRGNWRIFVHIKSKTRKIIYLSFILFLKYPIPCKETLKSLKRGYMSHAVVKERGRDGTRSEDARSRRWLSCIIATPITMTWGPYVCVINAYLIIIFFLIFCSVLSSSVFVFHGMRPPAQCVHDWFYFNWGQHFSRAGLDRFPVYGVIFSCFRR